MKIAPLLLTCAALSALSGGIVARLVSPKSAVEAKPSSPDSDLLSRLTALESDREKLRDEVESLRARLANPLSTPEPERQVVGTSASELDALATKLRMLIDEAEDQALNSKMPVIDDGEFDVMAVAEELLDPNLSNADKNAIWSQIRDSGNIDAMVEWFRQRAEANPDDADAQAQLGEAYLEQLFGAKDMMSQGRFANSADAAFDRALSLNDQHWDARFQKAVSLSFWPPALGKQSAAIQQFETLIAQQKTQPLSPNFAQSYLFLGNMHQQMGNMEAALAAWNEGLAAHPDNAELQAQIDSASGQ